MTKSKKEFLYLGAQRANFNKKNTVCLIPTYGVPFLYTIFLVVVAAVTPTKGLVRGGTLCEIHISVA